MTLIRFTLSPTCLLGLLFTDNSESIIPIYHCVCVGVCVCARVCVRACVRARVCAVRACVRAYVV